jgi:hypothetical protein
MTSVYRRSARSRGRRFHENISSTEVFVPYVRRRLIATIAIVTFVVLVLELTSTRLFAYIGSSHATSTALSIALLGLGIGAAVRVRWPRAIEWAALGLAAALWILAASTAAGSPLAVLVVLSLVPFALAGILTSDAYAERGGDAARATYAIDLGSAATGCLIAPHLIGPLSPAQIIAVLGLVCCTLAKRRVAIAVIALALASLLVIPLPDGPLRALLRSGQPEKAIIETTTSPRDVVDSAWSPLGRLDVHRTPGDETRLGVFTDGMSPTYMVRPTTAFESTWGLLMSLPYRALHPDRVLVLGAGAGASVWLAKQYGASRWRAGSTSPATCITSRACACSPRTRGDIWPTPATATI